MCSDCHIEAVIFVAGLYQVLRTKYYIERWKEITMPMLMPMDSFAVHKKGSHVPLPGRRLGRELFPLRRLRPEDREGLRPRDERVRVHQHPLEALRRQLPVLHSDTRGGKPKDKATISNSFSNPVFFFREPKFLLFDAEKWPKWKLLIKPGVFVPMMSLLQFFLRVSKDIFTEVKLFSTNANFFVHSW